MFFVSHALGTIRRMKLYYTQQKCAIPEELYFPHATGIHCNDTNGNVEQGENDDNQRRIIETTMNDGSVL